MKVDLQPTIKEAKEGMIFVEVILAVFPFLLLVLGLTQLMLLHAGKLVVMRSANSAVRAAVVVLDDNPAFYAGEPRNQAPPGSLRHVEIARAAGGALVAVAPSGRRRDLDNLGNALKGPREAAGLPQLLSPGQTPPAYRVSFSNNESSTFGISDSVTVRVEYDFECLVPLARFVLCSANRRRTLTSESTLPNQGATYQYHPCLNAQADDSCRELGKEAAQ